MIDTTTTTTTATVKSPLLSKTNITGVLLALFGVLGIFDKLPAGFDVSSAAGTLVTAGGALVVLFRTFTKAVLIR